MATKEQIKDFKRFLREKQMLNSYVRNFREYRTRRGRRRAELSNLGEFLNHQQAPELILYAFSFYEAQHYSADPKDKTWEAVSNQWISRCNRRKS